MVPRLARCSASLTSSGVATGFRSIIRSRSPERMPARSAGDPAATSRADSSVPDDPHNTPSSISVQVARTEMFITARQRSAATTTSWAVVRTKLRLLSVGEMNGTSGKVEVRASGKQAPFPDTDPNASPKCLSCNGFWLRSRRKLPTIWNVDPKTRTVWEAAGAAGSSEPDEEPADDALGRPDDEQFVVDRAGVGRIPEQVPHADQYFPAGAGEGERNRLVQLHVEPGVESGAGLRLVDAGIAGVDLVDHHDSG